jgi:hypothetical protein
VADPKASTPGVGDRLGFMLYDGREVEGIVRGIVKTTLGVEVYIAMINLE